MLRRSIVTEQKEIKKMKGSGREESDRDKREILKQKTEMYPIHFLKLLLLNCIHSQLKITLKSRKVLLIQGIR